MVVYFIDIFLVSKQDNTTIVVYTFMKCIILLCIHIYKHVHDYINIENIIMGMKFS